MAESEINIGLEAMKLIKDGFLHQAFTLLNAFKDKKNNAVIELARAITYLYQEDLPVTSLFEALKIMESIDIEELKTINPELVSDLYIYLSLSYERLGYTADAKKYEILANNKL
ncbi:MAG: hypothetical protein INQ03_11805 [Candidatus Heimdallarchaeota archaeon]|nr:hypothetical protein [Candidatus Heimdallarchaeota archaeon]